MVHAAADRRIGYEQYHRFSIPAGRAVGGWVPQPRRFRRRCADAFSCGSSNLPVALVKAEACGVAARGVGRRHILVEVANGMPTAEWLAHEGAAIARYFERIGGINPQITIDRGSVDLDSEALDAV